MNAQERKQDFESNSKVFLSTLLLSQPLDVSNCTFRLGTALGGKIGHQKAAKILTSAVRRGVMMWFNRGRVFSQASSTSKSSLNPCWATNW